MVQSLPILRCVTCKVRIQLDPRLPTDALPLGWQRVGVDRDGESVVQCPLCFRRRQR
jgi:hypothetical protein